MSYRQRAIFPLFAILLACGTAPIDLPDTAIEPADSAGADNLMGDAGGNDADTSTSDGAEVDADAWADGGAESDADAAVGDSAETNETDTSDVDADIQDDAKTDVGPVLCGAQACDDGNFCTVEHCVDGVCQASATGIQSGYFKPFTTIPGAQMGHALALEGDRLLVGAPGAGMAYLYTRVAGVWQPEVALPAPVAAAQGFGVSVGLSGDTAVIGSNSETACVYTRSNKVWSLDACLTATGAAPGDLFGRSVAIAGSTIVIGAHGEGSGAIGVNGADGGDSAPLSGAAYVFVRKASGWVQTAWLKPSFAAKGEHFGYAVAIAGNTIAVGAVGDATSGTGVNPIPGSTGKFQSGAVFLFHREDITWSQEAWIKASNAGANDLFGHAVALSGGTLVVGAPMEGSVASGVNGKEDDDTVPGRGAAYVFTHGNSGWTQSAYLKPTNPGAPAFGDSVAVIDDPAAGTRVLVGAPADGGGTGGIDPPTSAATAAKSGAAYLFARKDGVWSFVHDLKAAHPGANDTFGSAVAVSAADSAVGAIGEASAATGVNGDELSDASPGSGAAYVFALAPDCDDADPCTLDACVGPTSSVPGSCAHQSLPTCAAKCGDGVCSGDESAPSCPADCAFLRNRYAGPCSVESSWAGCPSGYVCVARAPEAGGKICVADFETWDPIADNHPASDFTEFSDYVIDTKTGLYWAKAYGKWPSDPPACITETYGGFHDWRMPTEGELLSLVNYTQKPPSISVPGIEFPINPVDVNWLSATPSHSYHGRWGLRMTFSSADGHPWDYFLDNPTNLVTKCVRDLPSVVVGTGARFGVADPKVFLDRVSGLHWRRNLKSAGAGTGYLQAAQICSSNSIGLPGTGWRLPTAGEVRQLQNRQSSPELVAALGDLWDIGNGDLYWMTWTTTPGWDLTKVAPKTYDWVSAGLQWVVEVLPDELFAPEMNQARPPACVR